MLGQELADRREALELTQTQLGDLLGVTKQTIQNWENGRTPTPRSVVLAMKALEKDRDIIRAYRNINDAMKIGLFEMSANQREALLTELVNGHVKPDEVLGIARRLERSDAQGRRLLSKIIRGALGAPVDAAAAKSTPTTVSLARSSIKK